MKKEKATFSRWIIADYLKADEDIRAYLEVAAESGDTKKIIRALGDVARARNLAKSRPDIIETLVADDNPCLDTIMKILSYLGLRLTFAAAVNTKSDET